MSYLFYKLLNMSIVASALIVLVILLRLALRKLPKKYSYFLWLIPAFRLVCPFSFDSGTSIYNAAKAAGNLIVTEQAKSVPLTSISIGIIHEGAFKFSDILPYIWITVAVLLLLRNAVLYFKLSYELKLSTHIKDNIYETALRYAPFSFGLFKRKIYLPKNFDYDTNDAIIEHEEVHIKRFDCLVKTVAFGLVLIYWFNPLIWVAYKLMCYDQEMSCDEAVLKKVPKEEYANALYRYITRETENAKVTGFGTVKVKKRIKNIVIFKKDRAYMAAMGLSVFIILAVVGCTNPTRNIIKQFNNPAYISLDSIFEKENTGAGYYIGNDVSYDDVSTEELFVISSQYYSSYTSLISSFDTHNYNSYRQFCKAFDVFVERNDNISVLQNVMKSDSINYVGKMMAKDLLTSYCYTNNIDDL